LKVESEPQLEALKKEMRVTGKEGDEELTWAGDFR